MFSLRSAERVVDLEGFPQSSVGAPCPAIVATEHSLAVLFYVDEPDPSWDGTDVRMVGVESCGEPAAVVTFERPSIHTFGPPNDEVFAGHRLASNGLRSYGAFEILNSRWIRQLEKINSVHPRLDPKRYMEGKRHFILTFHDTTFECVARGYSIELARASIKELLAKHVKTVNA
jgi:hypothetical protein